VHDAFHDDCPLVVSNRWLLGHQQSIGPVLSQPSKALIDCRPLPLRARPRLGRAAVCGSSSSSSSPGSRSSSPPVATGAPVRGPILFFLLAMQVETILGAAGARGSIEGYGALLQGPAGVGNFRPRSESSRSARLCFWSVLVECVCVFVCVLREETAWAMGRTRGRGRKAQKWKGVILRTER
jgi:hypothetical protein